MNLSKFFIDRPIFAGVLSLLMLLAGLIALRALPVSEYPEVVPPSIVVRAQYPGANPKVIAETAATPLEESINGVENMLYMGSQATTDGLMTLTVTDRLARLPGVGQVQLFGSGDYSMRVWLDPQKVAQRGLSAGDVVRAIREQNVQAAAGVVGASPGVPGIDVQMSINAQGRLESEEDFGDIIVK